MYTINGLKEREMLHIQKDNRVLFAQTAAIVIAAALFLTIGGCLTSDDTSDTPVKTGAVSGRILDENGSPAAQITVSAARGSILHTAVTDSSGQYEFPSLAAGTYVLTPAHPFLPFSPSENTVTVAGGETYEASFTMNLSCTVGIQTSLGAITCELDYGAAPVTVANFMQYVAEDFYAGMIFHRVISGFVIQGGGYTVDMQRKITYPSIVCESDNGLSNLRGTIAMARGGDPGSATSQFFINIADNTDLDYRDETSSGRGYAVFGRVTGGMYVADAIAEIPVTDTGQFDYLPEESVVIVSVELIREF